MLEEAKGDHHHQRVPVQARPGPSFEVVEPQLFLHLLVRLLARPSMAAPSIRLRRSGRRPRAALIVAASSWSGVSAGRLAR
jgi:hypothetical protein